MKNGSLFTPQSRSEPHVSLFASETESDFGVEIIPFFLEALAPFPEAREALSRAIYEKLLREDYPHG